MKEELDNDSVVIEMCIGFKNVSAFVRFFFDGFNCRLDRGYRNAWVMKKMPGCVILSVIYLCISCQGGGVRVRRCLGATQTMFEYAIRISFEGISP